MVYFLLKLKKSLLISKLKFRFSKQKFKVQTHLLTTLKYSASAFRASTVAPMLPEWESHSKMNCADEEDVNLSTLAQPFKFPFMISHRQSHSIHCFMFWA